MLTEAGRAFRPEAERVLAALAGAREAVAEVRELTGGTLSIGMFGTASGFLLSRLVADFRSRHPSVRLRLVGQNSSEVAENVRRGRLEAGLVVLPVDDEGLEIRPARREEVVYVSREPERVREPVTIERLADSAADPLRRALRLERPDPPPAAGAGAARGRAARAGDRDRGHGRRARARGQRARRHDRPARPRSSTARRFRRLGRASFAEPLYDDFAFIARRGAPVTPAARAFLELAERRLAEFGEGVLYAGVAAEGSLIRRR